MGSLEEEKLLQMVHDFIESSESTITSSSLLSNNFYKPSTTLKHGHFIHSSRYFSLQKILMEKTREVKQVVDKVGKYMGNKIDFEKTTRLKQWLVKCLKLEGLRASLCHTSWVTTPSCPCGNYEYIEIVKEDNNAKGGTLRVIVDIDFKSQFELARPTQSYIELSSLLPIIFVGGEDKLNKIISLLCSAAEESLKEKGLHIPPWRRANYMMSKWKPSNSTNSYNKYPNNNNTNTTNNRNSNSNSNNNKFRINKFNVNYPSRIEKWVPPKLTLNERRIERGSRGSGLSNEFSNMGINCC